MYDSFEDNWSDYYPELAAAANRDVDMEAYWDAVENGFPGSFEAWKVDLQTYQARAALEPVAFARLPIAKDDILF